MKYLYKGNMYGFYLVGKTNNEARAFLVLKSFNRVDVQKVIRTYENYQENAVTA